MDTRWTLKLGQTEAILSMWRSSDLSVTGALKLRSHLKGLGHAVLGNFVQFC